MHVINHHCYYKEDVQLILPCFEIPGKNGIVMPSTVIKPGELTLHILLNCAPNKLKTVTIDGAYLFVGYIPVDRLRGADG